MNHEVQIAQIATYPNAPVLSISKSPPPSTLGVALIDGKIHIRTPRLFIRAAETEDLDGLHECMSDENSMRYWSCAPYTNLSQTTDFLDQMIVGKFNGHLDFSVCLLPVSNSPDSDSTTSPTFIGKAGLYNGHEIGFIFNKKYWGKGYAFEALDAILNHYWNRRLNSLSDILSEPQPVEADVDPRNDASLKLLRKLGFVKTGYAKNTFQTHLGWCDSVYLKMERPADTQATT
ncbi:acyl-CoA N-acyltransferase [Crepidotus variabilis]|uniref:Acyl-CoA N-acyltransferase n=1 Tax=Crepidotus variabilis TaxID=179855 RepID=A0A9P6EKD8_9AGAR|nr:acyl-CoA N-acyltransferase [Crepidotus variabilis]